MATVNNTGKPVNFNDFVARAGINLKEIPERIKVLQDSFMPFRVTEHFTRIIEQEENPEYKKQLVNIVLPPVGDRPFEGRFDPYGNVATRQEGTSFLQHKYESTLLVQADDACIANCQFCYKVREIIEEKAAIKSTLDEKLDQASAYLEEHPEIDNVLFTGGDPAFRRTSDLIKILDGLAKPDNIRVIRFATKGLAYHPQRFLDEELLAFFKRLNDQQGKRINIIAQYNHPAEIEQESQKALGVLQQTGVQIYGQPAIVRGVNDEVDTLVDLQQRFLDNNIQSYYLVAFMPVRGVEQYGMPLEVTFQRVAESKRKLNGLAKKGIFIAPHDFGKLEVCGYLPTPEQPEKIVLKWHEIAMPQYLPEELRNYRAEDVMLLDFKANSLYCIDDVFAHNQLPHL